jgi:hypothetical protein
VREVLDTFRVAARLGTSSLAAYVISMSQAASDVLAVELLQKEARMMVRGRCMVLHWVMWLGVGKTAGIWVGWEGSLWYGVSVVKKLLTKGALQRFLHV